MKQLLFPLLFLPCLALAQYPANANQKITLGEQTTADGLIFRGRLADTANLLTNKLDTSVYIVLDTGTRAMWYYRVSSTPKWTRLVDSLNNMQGLLSLSTKVTGTLPVANGGTGSATQNFVDLTTNQNLIQGTKYFTDLGSGRMSLNNTGTSARLQVQGINDEITGYFYNSNNTSKGVVIEAGTDENDYALIINNKTGTRYFTISGNGNVGIGTTGPAVQLHTTGGVRFATFAGGGTTTLSVDDNGNLARTSSIVLKKDVVPINYGLNEILQINPINFNWIDENKFGNENENGFIAEDVMSVIPNVVAADTHGLFMDYTKLIPILTKAIQEQQALIKALEQRILTLENK